MEWCLFPRIKLKVVDFGNFLFGHGRLECMMSSRGVLKAISISLLTFHADT